MTGTRKAMLAECRLNLKRREETQMPEKKTVGRELVEKSGINVETLLDLLVRNASAELTTFYYYTILRVNLIGLEGEGLKQIAEDARIEDRNHFEALVPRISGREATRRYGGISQYFRVPASKTPGQTKRHKRHASGVAEG
jgi:hypothetical protein